MQSRDRVGRTRPGDGGEGSSPLGAGAAVYRSGSALRGAPSWARVGRRLLGACALLLGLLSTGCQTNPVTGASELNFYSERDDIELGQEAYAGVLQGEPLVSSGQQLAMVERVMQRIAAVSHRPNYPWEVVLIDDPSTVNAFCLPGGKMAVYTGILPLCDDPQFGLETGLAVVMGHEIAHATHRHGTNRLTRAGFAEVAIAFTPEEWQEQAATGYQLFFGLPFSRGHETESDLRVGRGVEQLVDATPDVFMLRRQEEHQREARARERREVQEAHTGDQREAAGQRHGEQRVTVVRLGRQRQRQQHRAAHGRQEAVAEARDTGPCARQQPQFQHMNDQPSRPHLLH